MANDYRLNYTVLNTLYQSGSLQTVIGGDPGADGNLASIQDPAPTGVAIDANMPDPVVFSYLDPSGPSAALRVLLGKITTGSPPPKPSSTCVYTLVAPPGPSAPWDPPAQLVLATDVTLVYGGKQVATNPHGIAQAGDYIYIIDYDSQAIVRLGVNELTGTGFLTIANEPTDLSGDLLIDPDYIARGQAIIALKDGSGNDVIYALFIVSDAAETGYKNSILVKLSVDSADGALTLEGQVKVGLNATGIIPVDNGAISRLLIPAIGGNQQYNADSLPSNGKNSNIMAVDPEDFSTVVTLLTGDDKPTPPDTAPTAYDIHAVAASADPSPNAPAYILTLVYNQALNAASWRLYSANLNRLLQG